MESTAVLWLLTTMLVAFQTSTVTPRLIERGPMSQIEEPRRVAVTSAEEWRRLWRDHAGNRALPPVDFSRETVVAVFAGSRPTAGYTVDIVGARHDGNALLVEYSLKIPPHDAVAAQVLTAPFAIAAVPVVGTDVRFVQAP